MRAVLELGSPAENGIYLVLVIQTRPHQNSTIIEVVDDAWDMDIKGLKGTFTKHPKFQKSCCYHRPAGGQEW